MSQKVLLVNGVSFEERSVVVLSHLAALEAQAVEVVQYDAGVPCPSEYGSIIVKVDQAHPDLVIFTSTGYDRAAKDVRIFTREWDNPPRIAFISGDKVDLQKSKENGFVTIAADGSFKDYVALSSRAAFLKALELSPVEIQS